MSFRTLFRGASTSNIDETSEAKALRKASELAACKTTRDRLKREYPNDVALINTYPIPSTPPASDKLTRLAGRLATLEQQLKEKYNNEAKAAVAAPAAAAPQPAPAAAAAAQPPATPKAAEPPATAAAPTAEEKERERQAEVKRLNDAKTALKAKCELPADITGHALWTAYQANPAEEQKDAEAKAFYAAAKQFSAEQTAILTEIEAMTTVNSPVINGKILALQAQVAPLRAQQEKAATEAQSAQEQKLKDAKAALKAQCELPADITGHALWTAYQANPDAKQEGDEAIAFYAAAKKFSADKTAILAAIDAMVTVDSSADASIQALQAQFVSLGAQQGRAATEAQTAKAKKLNEAKAALKAQCELPADITGHALWTAYQADPNAEQKDTEAKAFYAAAKQFAAEQTAILAAIDAMATVDSSVNERIQALQAQVASLRTQQEKAATEQETKKKKTQEEKLNEAKATLKAECQLPKAITQHALWLAYQANPNEEQKNPEAKAFYEAAKQFAAVQPIQLAAILVEIDAMTTVVAPALLRGKITAFNEKTAPHKEKMAHVIAVIDLKAKVIQEAKDNEQNQGLYQGNRALCSSFGEDAKKDSLFLNDEWHYCSAVKVQAQADAKAADAKAPIAPHADSKKRYQTFQDHRLAMLKELDALSSDKVKKDDLASRTQMFSVLLKKHGELAEDIKKMREDHAVCMDTKNKTMTAQKLNRHSAADLEYWDKQTTKGWHGFGGTPITLGDKKYRVPAHVSKMMDVIQTDYPTDKAFLAAFHEARKTSSWSITCIADSYRSSATMQLYSAKDEDVIQQQKQANKGP